MNAARSTRRDPLKVMHVTAGFGRNGVTGGMEHNVIKLVNGLVPLGIQSSVCSLRHVDPALKAVLHPSIGTFGCHRKEGTDPRVIVRLWQAMRREQPTIVHTHGWGTLVEGYAAARMARVPVLVHGEHGTLQTVFHQRLVQRYVWRQVDQVLSVSRRLQERIAADIGFPSERIRTIPNGVDLSRFTRCERWEARRRLDLHEDALVLGTVGRLVPVKDHKTLFAAVAHLRRRGVPVRALVAGEGPLRQETEAHIQALGVAADVTLLGYRSDPETVLAALDVFVLSSLSEGLSNTILEAMAVGVPVVATRVGGADELIDDGGTGILVPPADPIRMADALESVLSDRERRVAMGRLGQRRALELFSLERMLASYSELYHSLARRKEIGSAQGVPDEAVSGSQRTRGVASTE